MEILAKSGDSYPVNYSLVKTKDGDWQIANMTIAGVNIGRSLQSQFQVAYARTQDIDQAILSFTSSK